MGYVFNFMEIAVFNLIFFLLKNKDVTLMLGINGIAA